MAIREIRKLGDPVLRKVSEKVEKIDRDIMNIIKDMVDTINSDDYSAVGLAAPQIGVSKRIIVVKWDNIGIYLNPEIKIIDNEEEEMQEGCLSVYSIACTMKRPKKVSIKAVSPKNEKLNFKAEGMLARIFLHEVDHLNGKLFIDYLDSNKKREIMLKISEINSGTSV
ncbi:MAG: peptide deformylase [Actinomycetota bacterium]|nr:peptide deformylase [Actinomycetota bacterium]